jgi:hypothetical protein
MNKYLLTASASLVISFGFTACSDAKQNFFNLSCSSETTCTRTAMVYTVNVDGIYIKLDPWFVEECLEKRQKNIVTSSYCKNMLSPGDAETFTTTPDVIQYFKKNGTNPPGTAGSSREKAAREKVYKEMI